ncbi:oxaloacetate decarboxylase [Streptomyces althioticus]|uniref:isocitrate lyase/PEP mutase family protein n=1 Tax=Streptomyces althioticus TaxID=83380 RepID=UPI0036C2E85C
MTPNDRYSARRATFQELVRSPEPLLLAGAYDALSARLVERAGFPATYLGSFGAAASTFALPDVGLLTLTELADAARRMAAATSLPVLVDGEAGFYEAPNVWRAVEAFEAAGVVGMHIEDNLGGKHTSRPAGLLRTEEMTQKIRAALDARTDSNFMIIARSDAAWVTGDIEECVTRLEAYVAAGADMVFAPAVPAVELREIRSRIDAPFMVAGDLNDAPGGNRPSSTIEEYAAAGADVVLLWFSLLGAAAQGVVDTLDALKGGREVADLDRIISQHTFEDFMGYADYERRAAAYDAPGTDR